MADTSSRTDGDPVDTAEQEYIDLQDTEWQDADEPETFPSGDTVLADRRDGVAPHDADRPATPDEEEAAPDEVDPEVARAHRAANARGARVQGEGRIG